MSTSLFPQAQKKDEIKDVSPDESTLLGLGLAWEMGYMIAIPAILFSFGGAWMDKTFHTSPLFLLVGIACAFTISFASIASKIKQITNRIPRTMPPQEKPHDAQTAEAQDFHDTLRPPS